MYKLRLTDIYKQLKEQEVEPAQQYKIYCDMDGVLTDFDKRFKDLNPEYLSAANIKQNMALKNFGI